jgi:hypothetical protein
MGNKFKVIDGDKTLLFDTPEERDAYLATKPSVWDKEAYSKECSAAHSEWYRQIYTRKPDLDYESKGEIAMYLSIEDEKLRAQATSLTNLWFQSVDMLYAHLSEVTEATANVDAFIQSLPNFEPAP